MIQQSALWWDKSWSPVTGCNPISEGCRNCWAERMARRLAGRCGYPDAPHHFDVTLHPDRLDQPLRWKKPRRVFVCSMGDLFHKKVPNEFIGRVWAHFLLSQRHTFQVLTKRPRRMLEAVVDIATKYPVADNVWLGTSVENQEQADKRIPDLLQTPAAVRFVSVEPMLGPVRWLTTDNDAARSRVIGAGKPHEWRPTGAISKGIDWIVIGCESGPNRRPMELEWAIDLVRQCDAANVAVFVKQLPINGRVSHDPNEWPAELQRREYPK